jgi:hypothetical protein
MNDRPVALLSLCGSRRTGSVNLRLAARASAGASQAFDPDGKLVDTTLKATLSRTVQAVIDAALLLRRA